MSSAGWGAAFAVAVAGGALAAVGCGGDGTSTSTNATGQCYLAFDAAFAGFRQWPTTYTYDGGEDGGIASHVAGPRTEWMNHVPPAGSQAFPDGTIIVKEVGTSPDTHHVFAMAKRGCGYGAGGAPGWEWFELDEPNGVATVRWRGVGPPSGEQYGGDATCSACHAGCTDNDSVCSPRIRLSSP